jgi:tripartite-type tricarboxylate transporter receptor subunit TctC
MQFIKGGGDMKHLMLLLGALGALAAGAAQAQDFPARPLKIVVPYAPGGSTDILTRLLAQKLTSRLGQGVVVENRPGANGVIGTEAVAKSPGDGYTYLMVTNGQTISVGLGQSLPWDLDKDFTPIVNVAAMPNVIAVHPSQPHKTIGELIAAAKAQPGKLSYSHAGLGSPQHLAGELFKLVSKVDIVGVPYKGGGPAVADAVAGQVQVVIAGVPPISGHVASGKLRALAVTGLERSALLPDVPTVAESGYPGFDAIFWIALLGPKGVPAPIVQRMNAEVNAFLKEPETAQQFTKQGATPAGGTPAELSAYMKKDIEMWARVAKEANVKVDK